MFPLPLSLPLPLPVPLPAPSPKKHGQACTRNTARKGHTPHASKGRRRESYLTRVRSFTACETQRTYFRTYAAFKFTTSDLHGQALPAPASPPPLSPRSPLLPPARPPRPRAAATRSQPLFPGEQQPCCRRVQRAVPGAAAAAVIVVAVVAAAVLVVRVAVSPAWGCLLARSG